MTHPVPARHSAASRIGRALVEAGVVLSLMLAILTVLCLGVDRAAAAGLDGTTIDTGRATAGAVLLAIFAGLCVLTTFMMRNTLAPARRERIVRQRGRQG